MWDRVSTNIVREKPPNRRSCSGRPIYLCRHSFWKKGTSKSGWCVKTLRRNPTSISIFSKVECHRVINHERTKQQTFEILRWSLLLTDCFESRHRSKERCPSFLTCKCYLVCILQLTLMWYRLNALGPRGLFLSEVSCIAILNVHVVLQQTVGFHSKDGPPAKGTRAVLDFRFCLSFHYDIKMYTVLNSIGLLRPLRLDRSFSLWTSTVSPCPRDFRSRQLCPAKLGEHIC